MISDNLIFKISLGGGGGGGGKAPIPPYLLHAYAHSNCRILFADQRKKERKVQDSYLGLLNSGQMLLSTGLLQTIAR